MANLKYVFDATAENFEQLVVQNSQRGLVLANYWAPNAGPCLKLWHVLEGLSQEYQGHFLLVNINTETQQQLVRQLGITSVPTIKFYQKGSVVDAVYGAHSKASVKDDIDKYVNPLQDEHKATAINKYQQGDVEGALMFIRETCEKIPSNTGLHVTALKILLREERYSDLEQYVETLPQHSQQQSEVDFIFVHSKILQLAGEIDDIAHLDAYLRENPKDLSAALQRAAVAVTANDTEFALEYLLYILGEDKHFADGFVHKVVLSVFANLGPKSALTKMYQERLRKVLEISSQ